MVHAGGVQSSASSFFQIECTKETTAAATKLKDELNSFNVTIKSGEAHFVNPHTLKVGKIRHIVIGCSEQLAKVFNFMQNLFIYAL